MFAYSDGVWDPEKWHASLYPTSERSSPVEGFKKDYVDDRIPLKRRIPGKWPKDLNQNTGHKKILSMGGCLCQRRFTDK